MFVSKSEEEKYITVWTSSVEAAKGKTRDYVPVQITRKKIANDKTNTVLY